MVLAPAVAAAGLLGLPWAQANCAVVCARALAALGRPCPWLDAWANGPLPDDDPTRTPAQQEAAWQAAADAASARWRCLGAQPTLATALGDLLVLRGSGVGGYSLHVAVLVDVGGGRFLTSTPTSGCTLAPRRAMLGCLGVYRWNS